MASCLHSWSRCPPGSSAAAVCPAVCLAPPCSSRLPSTRRRDLLAQGLRGQSSAARPAVSSKTVTRRSRLLGPGLWGQLWRAAGAWGQWAWAAAAKHHRPRGLNSRHSFPYSLEVGPGPRRGWGWLLLQTAVFLLHLCITCPLCLLHGHQALGWDHLDGFLTGSPL